MAKIVQGFHDPKVGAICGHADVLNLHDTWLTKMQAVRYFVAFKVVKAAESVFSAVTCCSGCFSVYRRAAVMPHLEWWENQTLPRRRVDLRRRPLADQLRAARPQVRYESQAVSHTIVPETFSQFMTQQTRWKRSWTRESLIVGSFIYRKNPVAAISAYVGMLLPLIAPIVALRAVIFMPVIEGAPAPIVYALGVYAMAVAYGLYYVLRRPTYSSIWVYGIVFCFFYLVFLLWQTYYAILTARTSVVGHAAGDGGAVAARRGPGRWSRSAGPGSISRDDAHPLAVPRLRRARTAAALGGPAAARRPVADQLARALRPQVPLAAATRRRRSTSRPRRSRATSRSRPSPARSRSSPTTASTTGTTTTP